MLPVFQDNTHKSLTRTAINPNLKLTDSRAQLGGSLLGQSMIPVVTTVLLPTERNAHCSGTMTVSLNDWWHFESSLVLIIVTYHFIGTAEAPLHFKWKCNTQHF